MHRRWRAHPPQPSPASAPPLNRLRVGVVITVVAVWVVSFLATIFVNPDLQGLATLATPVVTIAVGWLGAGEVLDRRNPRPTRRPQEDTAA